MVLKKFIVPSTGYALACATGIVMLCRFSAFTCKYDGVLVLTAWAFPVFIVFGGLFIVGMGVTYFNFYIYAHMKKTVGSSFLRFVLGSVSGVLPQLLWYLVSGAFMENLYPSFQYVPSLLGGMAVALLCTR